MKILLTTIDGDLYPLEVPMELKLGDFKQLCAAECGIKLEEIMVSLDGQTLLDDEKSLTSFNLKEGDLILVKNIPFRQPANALDFSNIQVPGADSEPSGSSSGLLDKPARIRDMYLGNPEQLALLRQNNPSLAEALEKGGDEFAQALEAQKRLKQEEERRRLMMLQADPFNPEAQKLIHDEINRQNIASNMEAAIEYHPESFGTVHMLYINCRVNGHPVKAFVDSGAQSTIMSNSCAERCHVTKLIDTRWSGIAKGVGTQKIKGRIHLCDIQIEDVFLPSPFIILEGQDMDMLLGLDMLKRHQCCIDLKDNILLIGTTGTKTKFLDEKDIPKFDKFH